MSDDVYTTAGLYSRDDHYLHAEAFEGAARIVLACLASVDNETRPRSAPASTK